MAQRPSMYVNLMSNNPPIEGDAVWNNIQNRLAPGSQRYDVPAKTLDMGPPASTRIIVDAIARYARDHGTLSQLVLDGHGSPGSMAGLGDMGLFLGLIDEAEKKYGIKIADRFVFNGCDTFSFDRRFGTEGTIATVETLRNYATINQVELVGTTTFINVHGPLFGNAIDGRYVAFTPDGGITRDRIDKLVDGPLRATLSDPLSWEEAYIDHTPAQGKADYRAQPGRQTPGSGRTHP